MTWTAELLVEREVYYCMSSLVGMLLEKGIFDWSEIEQKGTLPTEDELKEEWEDEWGNGLPMKITFKTTMTPLLIT